MTTPLTEAEFAEQLHTFERSAFRLELQREYREPTETDTLARFLAGDPQDPTEVPSLRAWYVHIAAVTRRGRHVERVRVHDEPPTGYQRWERWIGTWNIAAGETMRYLTRQQAYDIGLLPAAGNTDWWLLDETRLIILRFDEVGHRIANEITTDQQMIDQACTWRELAIRYGVLERPPNAATA
ncbi:DUF6879 family protein [Planosporangium mesophilum]|uniref:DUF6879 domain-containing protein n=1 Tax=Planosporangium mesophilum TaxID=689768 RepID=A0A8J3TFI6_9ACTN|nr:DUF6879 family protein [Planosporangium mesophilum]NJC82728.1 hypothetical protein [Planosporangium mesophilum]GII23804.1 hypothetical protein Pme01_34010 [Planosporangium mesophilum]